MNALLLIDIQKDFLPGGALPVAGGDEIIPVVNELQQYFDLIIATQDWHPAGHGSFASSHMGKIPGAVIDLDGVEQILWPDHCVQGTPGAEFAGNLHTDKIHTVIRKGIDPLVDSYSGFFDNRHKRSTGLHDFLLANGVETVYITGLAADICVKYTALDASDLGYETFYIKDATRAVGGDEGLRKTLSVLENKGVNTLSAEEIIRSFKKQ